MDSLLHNKENKVSRFITSIAKNVLEGNDAVESPYDGSLFRIEGYHLRKEFRSAITSAALKYAKSNGDADYDLTKPEFVSWLAWKYLGGDNWWVETAKMANDDEIKYAEKSDRIKEWKRR